MLKPESFLKKGKLIPRPVKFIPGKFNNAYDFVGEIPPDTSIDNNNLHFSKPTRKLIVESSDEKNK